MSILKEKGFTLIELMVVVAIIGLLSAIAVPNYLKYQAKAKTVEAKLQLTSIYNLELASLSENDSYASCIGALGYRPVPKGYYIVGFENTFGTAEVSEKIPECDSLGATQNNQWFIPTPNYVVHGNPQDETDLDSGGTKTTFTAAAAANLTDLNVDKWTINDEKTLIQTTTGY